MYENYIANYKNFLGASNKIQKISSISSCQFKFQKISWSYRHPVKLGCWMT